MLQFQLESSLTSQRYRRGCFRTAPIDDQDLPEELQPQRHLSRGRTPPGEPPPRDPPAATDQRNPPPTPRTSTSTSRGRRPPSTSPTVTGCRVDDVGARSRETNKQRRERVGFLERETNKQRRERERKCRASHSDPRRCRPHPVWTKCCAMAPFSRSPLSTKPSSPRTPELARFLSSVRLRVSQSRRGPEEGEGRRGDGRGGREKSGGGEQ
ncbi:hypothetical protein TIFTF001_038603 [Ficus carica]|uniref:Uncharacterized protein n=1 Tax=Ficus carica TaxID=3494 RepID=A0AA88E7J4_FICCA|nr:hypothetical protein TIFTF001_038603 [Ficus carica]